MARVPVPVRAPSNDVVDDWESVSVPEPSARIAVPPEAPAMLF
jgi:hypothetical protein